jgi:hypothetical protein
LHTAAQDATDAAVLTDHTDKIVVEAADEGGEGVMVGASQFGTLLVAGSKLGIFVAKDAVDLNPTLDEVT